MGSKQGKTVLRVLRTLVDTHREEQASDRELLRRFVDQRDEDAFTALVRRHGAMVLGVGLRVIRHQQDAEDVCQATFLLLASKARLINWRDSVANWLYEVAYRLARKARDASHRRSSREAKIRPKPAPDVEADITLRDLQKLLDEELSRLPKKYRAPLLLCCLEGKSRDEAAQCLGLPLASIKSRLEEGRERLRRRLADRGVPLAVALAGVTLLAGSARATLPAGLVRATRQAALAALAGEITTQHLSAKVARLIHDGVESMTHAKLRAVTSVLFLVGALGLGSAALLLAGLPQTVAVAGADAACRPDSRGTRRVPHGAVREVAADPQTLAPVVTRGEITVRGRVLGIDGQPLAGAKLLLLGKGDKAVELGTSAADGRFTVAVPKEREDLFLVARVDGAGIDFVELGQLKATDRVELRVVKDQAIRGKIVNTEGKGIAGVRVLVNHLGIHANNSLDAVIAGWKSRSVVEADRPRGVRQLGGAAAALFGSTTDGEGRFVLHGTGSERFVSLAVSGGGIARADVWIANRGGFDPKSYNEATLRSTPKWQLNGFSIISLLYGPDLTFVATREKVIRGSVTGADTGKGHPGVTVFLERYGNGPVPYEFTATTDANGRYQIHGAPEGKSYQLCLRCDADRGYLPCQIQVTDKGDNQPVTADFHPRKGIVVSGRVIDKSTGKGVPGIVSYAVLEGNSFFKDYPGFPASPGSNSANEPRTAMDGTFRFVTIPGPVLLQGWANFAYQTDWRDHLKYKPALPDPDYPKYFHLGSSLGPGHIYFGYSGGFTTLDGKFCKVLNAKAGDGPIQQNVFLEPADTVQIRIQDADGQPLPGALVAGMYHVTPHDPVRCETDSCTAYNREYSLAISDARVMAFYHPMRKLAGTLPLNRDAKKEMIVKLMPTGSVKGRLVGADGKPLVGMTVGLKYQGLQYHNDAAQKIHQAVHKDRRVVTDASGAFEFDGVIPGGLKFELTFRLDHSFKRAAIPADPTFRVRPGERLDVGELKLRRVWSTGE
jgi:RNA polymerase sigma factor (sigma-70 family)